MRQIHGENHLRGRITSGGASYHREKRNIPFVIVVKGGEIRVKKIQLKRLKIQNTF